MVDHCRVRIADGLAKVAPFTWGPAVGKRDVAGGLGPVEDASGGGAGNRFGVAEVRHVGVAVGRCSTDISEPLFMQDPQRRDGARLHGKGVNRHLG